MTRSASRNPVGADRMRSGTRCGAMLFGAPAIGVAVIAPTIVLTPKAWAVANPIGNFNLIIPDRTDFHTWIWSITACPNNDPPVPDCVQVNGIAQPNAKAFNYSGQARLSNGRYSATVDDPYGLRCGNVYYGPTAPTHDVYSWDSTTLTGTLESSFDVGCDGAAGMLTYPISLARL